MLDENYVAQVISGASNIKAGDNPAFTASDFYGFYPRFKNSTEPLPAGYSEGLIIPDVVFDIFLQEANARVQKSRWHSQWTGGMCNYIAHKATLYLAATSGASDIPGLIASSSPRAVMTSKTVDSVSVSYDVESVARDLDGFGDFKATTYGQQFASTAKLLGKGGMGIW